MLGVGLVALALRVAHLVHARAGTAPPPPSRRVPRCIAGVAAVALRWAALPRLAFDSAAPARRVGAKTAMLAAPPTETLALPARSRVAIAQAAVEPALDDIGTGHPSLCSLTKQPVSLLRIDRSFVEDATGGGDETLVLSA